jgi:hypothetical protein
VVVAKCAARLGRCDSGGRGHQAHEAVTGETTHLAQSDSAIRPIRLRLATIQHEITAAITATPVGGPSIRYTIPASNGWIAH